MKGWTSIVQSQGNVWIPTHVGSGPALLFALELAGNAPRISTRAASQTARFETAFGAGSKSPLKGYFVEFGGLFFPVVSWEAVRFDEFSKYLRLETAGTVGGDALRQLDMTMDLRDNLVHFTRN